ncbi:MAG: hypothetical protein DRP89_01965 [Candidatus Neomarinimicrobiota bacterium]|nr:MAG: hypothetical protein DRP89_01965 [Candidatus Neomarinimicrobiota bacterium]
MKKFIIYLFVSFMPLFALGQNLQIHYDLGREHFTSTLEMFNTDNLGSTFWFVDFDYNNSGGSKNASLGYWEIARYFAVSKVPNTSLTIQYNDGLTNEFSFNPVWLGGIQYVITAKGFSLPFDFLLRRELNTKGITFQLTSVWFYTWKDFEITGYIDIWNTGPNAYPASNWAFQAEPQFWYNICGNIMIGTEIEISRNFSGAWTKVRAFKEDKFFVIPTIALKWVF